jgi:hypothetical protein
MSEKYIAASLQRIRDWCKSNCVEIPDVAWVAIYSELKTMFNAGCEKEGENHESS